MAPGRVIWLDRGWLPVYFGFCPSEAAWKRELRRLGVPAEPYPTSDARATTFTTTERTVVIVTVAEQIDKKRDRIAVFGLIVHEAMHVWRAILNKIAEPAPGAELEAYAMQSIVMQLCKAYSDTRRRLG